MPGELTIQINGIPQVVSKLNTPALIEKPLRSLLNDLAVLGQRVAREEAPRDTAALQRSILIDVQPLYSRVYTPLNYAPVMEYGRKPGATMPPPNALAGWARRHGIPQSALFVLARSIGKRGIKGRFFMKKAHAAVLAAMPARLDRMGREVERLWGK